MKYQHETKNATQSDAAAEKPFHCEDDDGALYQIVVDCRDSQQQEELFDLLSSSGYECRVITL